MKLNRMLAHWIAGHHTNPLLIGLITFGFPRAFVTSYYRNNRPTTTGWDGRKAALTISFDCDYPRDVEAIPVVLKELSAYPFKTSFACVGHWIEKYPAEHRMILDAGHEIMNHTYSHPDNELLNPGRKFKDISREEKKEEIEKCHDICLKYLRCAPRGCRIPHFKNLFSADIYGILKELGYRYSSSTLTMNTRTFGMPFMTPEGIEEFPLTTCPEHPFTVFDTWHSFNSDRLTYRLVHRSVPAFMDLFTFLLKLAVETGSYLNIYIDPYDVTRMDFPRFLQLVDRYRADLLVTSYEELLRQSDDVAAARRSKGMT